MGAIHRISPKFERVPEEALQVFRARYPNVPLTGYEAFLRGNGVGDYCDFLAILPPAECQKLTDETHRNAADDDFWEDGCEVLSQEEIAESVALGRSIDGDILVAHAKDRERLFVLPRHDLKVFWTDAELREPLRWSSTSGEERSHPDFEYFTPYIDRGYLEFCICGDEVTFERLTTFVIGDYHSSTDRILDKTETLQVGLLTKLLGRYQSYLSGSKIHFRFDYDTDKTSLLDSLRAKLEPYSYQCYGEQH